jgi:hypothetical protein
MKNNLKKSIQKISKKDDKVIEEPEVVESDRVVQKDHKKQGLLVTILSYKPILFFSFFLVGFIALILMKNYIVSMLLNYENKAIVHKDETSVSIDVQGYNEIVELDREKISKKILEELNRLESFKEKESQQFLIDLENIFESEFKVCYDSVELFADWFYSYSTQYEILYQAAKGILDNYRAGLTDFGVPDAAEKQVNDYISTKYKDLVLKPNLLEPSLTLKIKQLIDRYHDNKNRYIKEINDDFIPIPIKKMNSTV